VSLAALALVAAAFSLQELQGTAVEQARSLLEAGRAEEALEVLEQAAHRPPASAPPGWDAEIRWWAGWIHYRSGRWDFAREAFLRSLEGNPAYTNALYHAGRASIALEDSAGAEDLFLRLARDAGEGLLPLVLAAEGDAGPFSWEVFLLADRAFREGRLGRAGDLSEIRTALAPADVDAWNNLAFLRRQDGRYREAWEAYVRAAALRRGDPRLWNDAALIQHYYLQEDLPLARAMYERAIECAGALLLESRTSAPSRAAAKSALKDAQENLRRLLEGRRGPAPLR